jgi:hypothetical protein
MSRRLLSNLILTTLAALALPTVAQAGGNCCACPGPCVEIPSEFYVVNQGPVFAGPGVVVVPGAITPPAAPADYPYVGRDYFYPGYQSWPYGVSYVGRVHHRARYRAHRYRIVR